MKNLIASLLIVCCANASAAESQVLENALSCKLKDGEIASLMRDLAAAQPAFATPAKQYGAPSADVYQLSAPAKAWGYASSEVVVTSGRILLAVPGQTVTKAAQKLKLKGDEYSPYSRAIRPTVSVVAFQLSHQALAGKLLVGCEYGTADAAAWIRQ